MEHHTCPPPTLFPLSSASSSLVKSPLGLLCPLPVICTFLFISWTPLLFIFVLLSLLPFSSLPNPSLPNRFSYTLDSLLFYVDLCFKDSADTRKKKETPALSGWLWRSDKPSFPLVSKCICLIFNQLPCVNLFLLCSQLVSVSYETLCLNNLLSFQHNSTDKLFSLTEK